MTQDETWMLLALGNARRGVGLTSPNPAVGAVLVNDDRLVSTGWHRKAGGPHAEIEALRGQDARGGTLYVTLEPCSSHGKTPPCTDAIITAGVRRVVWGADDPNPKHAGRARKLLTAAGIKVRRGVLQTPCEELIAPFAKLITTGLPYVIAKAGLSLDGRITRPPGESRWLTGESARADAMKLRARCDAIIVGAETVRRDNPALTLRGPDIPKEKPQPWRVVLTRSGSLPEDAQIFTDAHRKRTLVMRDQSLTEVLQSLAARGAMTVLIEGGGTVLARAFSGQLVDEAVLYFAPLIAGAGRPVVDGTVWTGGSVPLRIVSTEMLDGDVKLRALRKC